MGFSYDLVDTDEAREIYGLMLEADVDKIVDWRDAASGRIHFPPDSLFAIWWMSKGPIGFKTGMDAVRYRRELLLAYMLRVGAAVEAAE